MSNDWKRIAKARNLQISDSEIERIGPVLDGLEDAFRPLLNQLPPDAEPAVTFRASTENEP